MDDSVERFDDTGRGNERKKNRKNNVERVYVQRQESVFHIANVIYIYEVCGLLLGVQYNHNLEPAITIHMMAIILNYTSQSTNGAHGMLLEASVQTFFASFVGFFKE